MDVRLVVKKGAAGKRSMRLKSEETIIGRRHDCDLRIRSAEVSRRHCLLSFQDGVLHVEDLDSVNGTFLNGQRVVGRQVARPGDELEIGPIRFVVEYQLSREAVSRLQQRATPEAEEEVDALPVVEDDVGAGAGAFNFGAEDELEALPLSDDADTEFSQPSGEEQTPPEVLPADDEEPIPIADEILEGKDWHLPQSNDLRYLLSQMDEPGEKKPAKDEE